MSTRAVYTFKDEHDTYAVYKHYDGYPEGAVEFIKNALEYGWGGGRFEAADLSAAFVAANKQKGGGDIYLTKGHNRHGDLDYDYVIYFKDGLQLDVYEHRWGEAKNRIRIYKGSFETYYAIKAQPQEEAA